MESLKVADKLKEAAHLREADQQPAANTATAQPTTAQQQAPTNVDQTQLEKAFEAALQTIKGEIVQEVQGLMEKFGETLVQKLNGGNGGNKTEEKPEAQQQPASNNNGNNGGEQPQEENTNGNK